LKIYLADSFLSLPAVPSAYDAAQYIRVNASGNMTFKPEKYFYGLKAACAGDETRNFCGGICDFAGNAH
jgi:hypothetical protein